MGQPYPGQPYPGPPTQGQPYPGQQYPAQAGPMGQPDYPQPGFPPGYQQPPFPGPAGPRKPRTGLIVLIVVLALVVVGGGTTALILLNQNKPSTANATGPASGGATSAPATSNSSSVGRYRQPPPACGQLNGGPIKFQPTGPVSTNQGITIGVCSGIASGDSSSFVGMAVTIEIYGGPGGVDAAKAVANDMQGQQVTMPGFENPPYAAFTQNACIIEYNRSNEDVHLQFLGLPGVTDAASCQSAATPYAEQYYKLVG